MSGLHCDTELTALKLVEKRHYLTPLSKLPMLIKSNSRADTFKKIAIAHNSNFDNTFVFNFYKRALLTAKYNSETYGLILMSISEYYFSWGKWQNCVKFIDMCFKCDLDPHLTVELYYKKIRALNQMQFYKEANDVSATLDQILEELHIPEQKREEYAKLAQKQPLFEVRVINDYFNQVTFQDAELNLSKKAKIHSNSEFGRHVIAKKLIKSGELILCERYYAALGQMVCPHCGEEIMNIIPCNLCTNTLYCSQECKFKDQDIHQWECIIFQREICFLSKHTTLGLRVFLKELQKGYKRDSNVEFESSGSIPIQHMYNNFKDIDPKIKLIIAKESFLIISHLMKNKKFIDWLKSRRYHEKDVLMIGVDLLAMISLCHNNSHGTINNFYEKNATCLYPNLSLFNHSCRSNAAIGFMNTKITLKAIEDIYPGEQIFINYLSYTNEDGISLHQRQKVLRETFNVLCNCRKCIEKSVEDYDCPQCGDYVYPPDFCLSCYKPEMFVLKQKQLQFLFLVNQRGNLVSLREAAKLADELLYHPNSDIMTHFHKTMVQAEFQHGGIENLTNYLPFLRNLYISLLILHNLEFVHDLKIYALKQFNTPEPYTSQWSSSVLENLLDHLEYIQNYMDLYYPVEDAFRKIKSLKDYYSIQWNILDFEANHRWSET